MKSKFFKYLAVSALCALLCFALASCNFSEKSVNDFFNQIVGADPSNPNSDDEKNKEENGEKNPTDEEKNETEDKTPGDSSQDKDETQNQDSPFAPSIGQNGNWWIGEVDLGVRADGTPTGAGIGIAAISLSSAGNDLTVRYTNNTLQIIPLPEVKSPCLSCTNVSVYALRCLPHTASFNAATETWSFAQGRGLAICKTCGDCRMVDCLTHTWGKSEVVSPTCAQNGYTKIFCSICNYYETLAGSETSKSDHTYAPLEGTEPPSQGCTEGYWILGICTTEGCSEAKYIFVEAKGHTVAEWQEDVAPTLTAEGSLIGACTVCNGTVVRHTLPALNETDYTYKAEEAVSCLKGGTATYTYVVPETNQSFSFQTETPPASHVVQGVLVTNMKHVDDALVYGQAGVEIFSSVIPKCGEIVNGFYTCDVCKAHFSTKVIGDHTWGNPSYQKADCTQAGCTVWNCTVSGCNGRFEEITEAMLPHDMTYKLTYNADAKVFIFGQSCSACATQSETKNVTPVHDKANSKPPQCNAAGYDLYVYTFLANGAQQSVSCKVENGAATGVHQLIVNGQVILPDEISPGVTAYSSEWIGKGLFVLTGNGQPTPDTETCGLVYEGFFECVCGAGFISTNIYNPHTLAHDSTHPANKAPTASENGITVFICTKADCDHTELVEIEKTQE